MRSWSRRVQPVDDGGQGHAKASPERAAVQAIRPATERGPASGIVGDTLLGALEGWVGLSAPCTEAMAVAQERWA